MFLHELLALHAWNACNHFQVYQETARPYTDMHLTQDNKTPMNLPGDSACGTTNTMFPGFSLWLRFPAFISWVAISGGIAASHFLSPVIVLSSVPHYSFYHKMLLISTCLIVIPGILVRKNAIRFLFFFTAGILVLQHARASQHAVFSSVAEQTVRDKQQFFGRVISPPIPWFGKYSFLLRITESENTQSKLTGKTVRCISATDPPRQGSVRASGTYRRPRTRKNPYEYDEYTNFIAQNLWGTIFADSVHLADSSRSLSEISGSAFRNSVLTTLSRYRKFEHQALLQAAFLGEKSLLSTETKDIFRKAGIYHLLAISGLHAGMLIAAAYLLFGLFGLKKTLRWVLALSCLWCYLWFIGVIPSLFRATIMATLLVATIVIQRKNYGLQALGIAGTSWLLLSPESLFLPGYQLSFAATLGIIVLHPALAGYRPRLKNPAADMLLQRTASAFTVSLAGFISTAPVLLYHFGTLSFAGLVTNLVAVGLMTLTMWLFFVSILLELLLPFAAPVPVFFSGLLLDMTLWIAHLADFVPGTNHLYPVPQATVVAVCILTLAGFAAVKRTMVLTYMKWSMPLLFASIPVLLLLNQLWATPEFVVFSARSARVASVGWPNGPVWLFVSGQERAVIQSCTTSVSRWIRHRAGNGAGRVALIAAAQEDRALLERVAPFYEKSKPQLVIIAANRSGTPESSALQPAPEMLFAGMQIGTQRDSGRSRVTIESAEPRIRITHGSAHCIYGLRSGKTVQVSGKGTFEANSAYEAIRVVLSNEPKIRPVRYKGHPMGFLPF